MPSIAQLAVQITGDSSGLPRDMEKAARAIKGSEGKLTGGRGGSLIGGTAGGVTALGGVAGGLAAGFNVATGALGMMIDMAGKAAPGAFGVFQDTLADLFAVIGQTFVPILKAVTPLIRAIANVFVKLQPVFNLLIKPIELLIQGLTWLVETVSRIINVLPDVSLGVITANPNRIAEAVAGSSTSGGPSSVGAAARQASFTGAEDFARRVYISAFQSGGRNPAEQTAENTRTLVTLVQENINRMLDQFDPARQRALLP